MAWVVICAFYLYVGLIQLLKSKTVGLLWMFSRTRTTVFGQEICRFDFNYDLCNYCQVIAKRKEDSGKIKLLLHWTPEDMWVYC